MGNFSGRASGLRFFFVVVFSWAAFNARADISDLPADGSFAFLEEGSLVVSFYQDRISGNRQEQKYLSFDLAKNGRVSSVDVTRASASDAWIRASARRLRNVPSLREHLGEGRWQNFQNQIVTILAQVRSPGGNRFHFSPVTRPRAAQAFDPSSDRSYSISIISGQRYSMRRELYDIDGVRASPGLVRESWRNPEQPSSTYEAAQKLVVARLREYLSAQFPLKR